MCAQTNNNIASLQTILVALQNNDCITAVVPVTENGTVNGYTITFAKSAPITIYNGAKGDKGDPGADGRVPVVGVGKDADGIYYWTLDGKWLTDASGNKIKTQGTDGKDGQDGAKGDKGEPGADGKDSITPKLKIEGGYWYVSTDGGATWTLAGKATGENG